MITDDTGLPPELVRELVRFIHETDSPLWARDEVTIAFVAGYQVAIVEHRDALLRIQGALRERERAD